MKNHGDRLDKKQRNRTKILKEQHPVQSLSQRNIAADEALNINCIKSSHKILF